MIQLRDKILAAWEKDLERRYIATAKLQADGRLELDKSCIDVLSPKDGEQFYVIDDTSSVIIVRKPLPMHESMVICVTKFDEKKKRLRLNQRAARILLTCTVGLRVFRYNDEVALEAEPYIDPPKDLTKLNLTSFDELAPYVLRSSRSVLHIDVLDEKQKVQYNATTFRILGEYWVEKFHQKISDINFELFRCKPNNCEYCQNKLDFPYMKSIYWFPIIAYETRNYPRPGLISFHMNNKSLTTMNVCADLVDKCERWSKYSNDVEQYHKHGIIDYSGENLFKIETNELGNVEIIDISAQHPKYTSLSIEEKGLMRLALKELESYIVTYKP
jgi:hypothetical protein